MRNFIIKLLLNALALWLTTRLYGGVYFERGGVWDVLFAALALGLVNALIRPVLLLLSLPVTVLTLGLFTLVVNGVVLSLVAGLMLGLLIPPPAQPSVEQGPDARRRRAGPDA